MPPLPPLELMPRHRPCHRPAPSTGTSQASTSSPALLPTDGDLYQCSCHISDIATLAGVLEVSGDELATLKQKYPDKKLQALQLLKQWRESTKGSRQDLSKFLLQINMGKAAYR